MNFHVTMRDYNTDSRNTTAGYLEDGLRPRNGTPKSILYVTRLL